MRKHAWARLLATACGSQPGPLPAPTTTTAGQLQCVQQGGRWAAIGRAQQWVCLVGYPPRCRQAMHRQWALPGVLPADGRASAVSWIVRGFTLNVLFPATHKAKLDALCRSM